MTNFSVRIVMAKNQKKSNTNKPKANKQVYGSLSKILTKINNELPKADKIGNVFKIPVARLIDIDWSDIGEFIVSYLPDNIFFQVSAGEFGSTDILQTGGIQGRIPIQERRKLLKEKIYPKFKGYNPNRLPQTKIKKIFEEYRQQRRVERFTYDSEIRPIVDNIRNFVNSISGQAGGVYPVFNGYVKLKPNKKENRKKPENYFIDFVLFVNGEPTEDIGNFLKFRRTALTEQEKEDENRRKKAFRQREGLGKKKKEPALKKVEPQIQMPTQKAEPQEPTQMSISFSDAEARRLAELNKALDRIRKDFDDKLISKKQYQERTSKIYEKFEKGGEL